MAPRSTTRSDRYVLRSHAAEHPDPVVAAGLARRQEAREPRRQAAMAVAVAFWDAGAA